VLSLRNLWVLPRDCQLVITNAYNFTGLTPLIRSHTLSIGTNKQTDWHRSRLLYVDLGSSFGRPQSLHTVGFKITLIRLPAGVFVSSYVGLEPVTVATRSKAWTVLARWDAGIVGSNPSQGVCVCFDSMLVLPCLYVAAFRRADRLSKESYHLWKMITELNKRPGPWMGWKSQWKKEK
jgi:hypothetical protein